MNKYKKIICLYIIAFFLSGSAIFPQKKTVTPEALQQAKLLRAFFSKEGVFGEMKPSTAPVEDVPDFSIYPVTIAEKEISHSLALFAKAFYLRKDFNEATVEFDRFLLPNAENAKISVTWNSLKTISGKDIIDKSAITQTDLEGRNFMRIPVQGYNEDDPVYEASGISLIKIPSKILRVDLSASDLNKPLVKGDYEIILRTMQNDIFGVYIKNSKKRDLSVISIMVTATGTTGRIKLSEEMQMIANPKVPGFIEPTIQKLENGDMSEDEFNAEMEKHKNEIQAMSESSERIYSGRALGTIKHLSILIPEEEIEKKIQVTATTEPDTNLENPAPIRANRYVNNPKPVFQSFSANDFKNEINIYSTRNSAMFGYNTPVVVCRLPQVSNSEYSTVEFISPVLLDKEKKSVPFELESGGYSSEKHSAEIRFLSADNQSILTYERAMGTVHIKYPVKVNTLTVKKNSVVNDAGVKFKGRFVTFKRDNLSIPENSFSKFHSIRAYDIHGLELYKINYSYSESGEEGEFETLAFWGEPDKVEVDTVEQWAEFDMEFSLPQATALPALK